MKINQQKSSDKLWSDESGAQIPYARTTPYERKTEKTVAALARTAIDLNGRLSEFKKNIRQQCEALYNDFLEENGGKIGKNKGGATFYLFDRSVKIEVAVNEQICFDDNLISLAKQKVDEFLDTKIITTDDAFKALVVDAFSRSRGKLDVRKVLSLKKHATRLNNPIYNEAMQLIDKAITRPQSREYFRTWIKDEHGAYQVIDLNFSSI